MPIEDLVKQAESWGVEITRSQEEALLSYAWQLAHYDRANIIGTKDLDEILSRHILDSLSCLASGALDQAKSMVDVGSGGGLPGVPIKVVRPEMHAAFLEATSKKAHFLSHVVEKLGLHGVEIINDRAETVGKLSQHRGAYDVATVRAVATLDTISEYCVPLVKTGGYVVSMKGPLDAWEIENGRGAALALGAEVVQVMEVPFLPGVVDKRRSLVVLRKVSNTPERYPRENGVPRKKPLGNTKRK